MGGDRPSVDEGLALIRGNVRPLPGESVPIDRALGRITAVPLVAARTVPGFRAAAMDGFCLRSQNVAAATPEAPVRLPIAARIAAGTWPVPLRDGSAAGIATGAPVPDGADAIVMIEHSAVETGAAYVTISTPARPGLNIREIGEDAIAGQKVLDAGHVITPDIVAGMAAYGIGQVAVMWSPRVALVVTGSELARDGAAIDPSAIIDANGPMIAATLSSVGAILSASERVGDDLAMLGAALDRVCATDADLVVTTGGASRGDYDFVRQALERRGARILFHGLSMRPGKPILFALLADGRPFFGLPGNPVSACIGMRFFVGQALRAMLGLPDERGLAVISDEQGRDDTTLFLRGTFGRGPSARFETPFDQRSHILSSLMAADHWLRVDRSGGETRRLAFPKTLHFGR
ncbi:molybdopterin molybdotransferase MoeA [Sphingomonas sp. BIUV-7]|uniref:Molybdopterin molybdenumtransferase n=1 Tax=Sphingomonas natans TaxID=3063330 RepID=A0ABT8YEF0_9SPHN|nr:molybdopterin molybdotransferase MoeA [Sphingomonas sp. BIUV-7]MDO6416723.1 molybdopterin molybdotransferase MoeA [Sphingomonas sp. BIUV-7]